MKFGGFGSGPVRGEQLRPVFGPMNVDSMQGRRGPSPMRPPGLVAPPVQQGQAPGNTGTATPNQGFAPQQQMQMPQPPLVNQQVQPQPMQQQMQGIMRDPFLMHIMRQRSNPGYGGQQFQRPFGQ